MRTAAAHARTHAPMHARTHRVLQPHPVHLLVANLTPHRHILLIHVLLTRRARGGGGCGRGGGHIHEGRRSRAEHWLGHDRLRHKRGLVA